MDPHNRPEVPPVRLQQDFIHENKEFQREGGRSLPESDLSVEQLQQSQTRHTKAPGLPDENT